jgi:hypothetical protein
MLSTRLIKLIEGHWEGISSAVIHQIRSDSKLPMLRNLPDAELREVGRVILKNLGHWLTADRSEQADVREHYEGLGRVRFAEMIPLHECVRGLQIAKHKVIEFMRDHEFAQSAVSIYAEEELEHSLNELFDDLVYHEVLGYETAMRQAGARPITSRAR